jgi:hypothetical protein
VAELSGWRDAISPYGYPGALVRGSFSGELESLAERVKEVLLAQQILTCFIRMNPMRPGADPILERIGTVVDGAETVFYDLQLDEAVIWKEVRTNHRRNVEALRQRGYTTRIDDWSDLPSFKALYRDTMARVSAKTFYLFDDDYFDRMREFLGERLHLVSVVTPEGEIVSSALFLTGGDRTAHCHLIGTCNGQVEASKLLYDAAWRWLKGRGFRALHIGGGMGRPNDHLLHFKAGLAKGRKVFRTGRWVADPERYRLACTATGEDPGNLAEFFPAYRRPAAAPAPAPAESAVA